VDEPYVVRGIGNRASFGQRFGAYFIDWVLLALVGVLVQSQFSAPREARLRQGPAFGWPFVVNLLIGIAYFVLTEGGRSGQTLGKRALRIRVVDFESGEQIDYRRALARTIGRYISGFVLFLGYLWMLWDRDKQTWHDKLASTTVVRVEAISGHGEKMPDVLGPGA
jgi:uncharacterized RDD family membrane protein YckC